MKKSSKKALVQSLDEFVSRRDEAKFKENQENLRGKRVALAEAREQKDRADRLERELGLYRVLDSAKTRPPEWATPKTPGRGHHAIPTLAVSDVHRGEKVTPAQVEGLNCYNLEIADQRIRRAFEGAVTLCRDYLKGVAYDGFVLALPGDMVSGDIQQGRETNVATIADSIMGLVEPLEAGINLAVAEFGKVHVVGVPGNHARNTLKPIAKNRAQDNWDYLAYRIIERDYRNNPAVTVQVSEAADAPFAVYATKYVLTHGDQFHGGSGISGALAPLLLGAHRKTRRAAASGRPYDSLVMGHFHQSIWYPSKGIIVSGCIIGYSEFAYVSNFEPEPPQAALWLTTPERGITVNAPVYVGDRAAEGW
jgi:hypothetical protein